MQFITGESAMKKTIDKNHLYELYGDSIPFDNTIVLINGRDYYTKLLNIELITIKPDLKLDDWEYCYIGDVNLYYGGTFYQVEFNKNNKAYKLQDWQYNYTEVLSLNELYLDHPSMPALLIEIGSVYISDEPKRIKSAIESSSGIYGRNTLNRQISIAESLKWYWGIESDSTILVVCSDDYDSNELDLLLDLYLDQYASVVILPNWDNSTILTLLAHYKLSEF